jgi:L,D-transpeptidase ErfK/SrfK
VQSLGLGSDEIFVRIRRAGLAAIVVGTLCLAGCGVVNNVATVPPEEPVTAEARVEKPPIYSNRFHLEEGQDVVGEIQVVKAAYDNTFVDIARAYGLGFDELLAANPGVDPWVPGEGTEIILPTRFVLPVAAREGLVLNVATKRLFYFPEPEDGGAQMVETYPIGIGRAGWETPTGDTEIVSKARDPIWFVPRSVREEHLAAGDPLPKQVPPGPDNPLGHHVLGLGMPGYLIHGTNKPAGVGMRVSHGCIRLYPENIEHLFDRVAIGIRVRIVNQPFLYGWQNGDFLLEAHAPLAEDDRDWFSSLSARARSGIVDDVADAAEIDEQRVMMIAEEQRGFPVSVLTSGADAEQQVRDARPVTNVVSYGQLANQ